MPADKIGDDPLRAWRIGIRLAVAAWVLVIVAALCAA